MNASPLLSTHAHAGARLAVAPGREAPTEVLLTYGDVPAEYKAATQGALVFDQGDRGLVEIRGADAVDFLHRVTANRIKGLVRGEGNQGLLLTSKGKIVEEYDLAVTLHGFRLSTPPERAAKLIAALDMFLFGEDVQLIDRTADYAPLVVIGPKASAVLGELLGLEPEFLEAMKERYWMAAELPQLGSEPLYITRVTVAGRSGWRLEAHPDHAPSLWQALVGEGATPGGLAIFDILRAEACVPLFGVDVDDSIYPQEARYEAAFSLDKGCYIGQEVVAKIDTYGGLNKRLYALATGEEPVRAGTSLMRPDGDGGWRDVGVLTSWAWSFALDSGLSLGYVKRRHQDVGTEFRMVSGDEDPATAPIAQLIETPLAPAENPE